MKKPTARAWTSVALGIVLVLVFLLSRTATVEAVYPVERARQTFVRQLWTRLVGSLRGAAVVAENEELKRELAALALLRTDLERLEAENARLRQTLGYTARHPEIWMPAGVLSTQGGAVSAHRTLRLDKGSLAGVKAGAVVSVPNGLVGRIVSVTPHTSEVMLLADERIKVACEIETGEANPPRGILVGGSEDLLELKYLMRAENVPPRARVITSGLGGVFPRGLEVGTYLSEGKVLPAVGCSDLEDVFIRREK